MALINCPECQKEISELVKTCPHCGYPVNKKKISKKTLLYITVGFAVLAGLTLGILYNNAQIAKEAAKVEAAEKAATLEREKELISEIDVASRNAIFLYDGLLSVWRITIEAPYSTVDFGTIFAYISGQDDASMVQFLDNDTRIYLWGESNAIFVENYPSQISSLKKNKQEIDIGLQELKNSDATHLTAIVDYYNSFTNLYNAVVEINANYLTYSSNYVKLKNELNNNKSKVSVLE